MNTQIPSLQKGDLIYITAPAKSIDAHCIDFAKNFFEANGFNVLISEHCLGVYHYFSGSDEQRAADFQFGLDHPEVKAIICARGGYGCIRILDMIQWAGMLRHPKWIIGFSDVTIFHQRMQRFELPSIHGTMPLNFESNSKDALKTLLLATSNETYSIETFFYEKNKPGIASGKLVGGNLSILYSLLGTDDQIDFDNSILFIEDLSEQIYHLDRMFYAFAKAGILEKIQGLIVGGLTDMKDTAISFGKTCEEVILEHLKYKKIPIAFHFPAGHIDDNQALVLGRKVTLQVTEEKTKLEFLY
ncbi:MAG: LD-carboxypeptidase [Flavobacteriia bacterium]|nr:LD-carboxypeptidase [Flavobacteriia bacterium]